MRVATVTIEDHAGKANTYALRRLPAGLCLARYELVGDHNGEIHEVRLWRGGWACDCRSFEFRFARHRVRHRGTCLHCVEVAKIHDLLAALGAAPEPAPAAPPSVFDLTAPTGADL